MPPGDEATALESFLLRSAVVVWIGMLLASSLALPYFNHDELALSEWSRLIAADGGFFHPSITPLTYQRPLPYLLQGWLWLVVGHSEVAGRALASAFLLLLLWSVHRVGKRLAGGRVAAIAVLAILCNPTIRGNASLVLTDVPLAAFVAAGGAIALCRERGVLAWLLLAAMSAATILAKPSGAAANLGLVAATWFAVRGRPRVRIEAILAILVGSGVAVLYGVWISSRLGLSVSGTASTGAVELPFYLAIANDQRIRNTLYLDWMGGLLRMPFAFAIAFVLVGARTVSVAGRRWSLSIVAGVGLALVALLVSSLNVRSRRSLPLEWMTFAATLIWLLAAFRSRAAGFPDRRVAGIFAVWGVPALLAWILFAPYTARLLSPAFPAAALLVATLIAGAMRGFESRGRTVLAVLGPVAMWCTAIHAAFHLCYFDPPDWVELLSHPGRSAESVAHRDRIALEDFYVPLRLVEAELGDTKRVISPEGRFRYFFPGRANQSYPAGCGGLAGADVFVLPRFESVQQYFREQVGVSPDPEFWESCAAPRLERLGASNDFIVYRIHED